MFTKYMNGDFEASDPLPSITSDLPPRRARAAWFDPNGVQKGFWSFNKSQQAWKLTLAANSTTNEAKRKLLFGTSQRVTLADAPWIPMFFVPARTGLGARSRTSTPSRAGGGIFGKSGKAEHRNVRGPLPPSWRPPETLPRNGR